MRFTVRRERTLLGEPRMQMFDVCLARLRAGASRWASLPVARKIEFLAACRDATGCVARDWTGIAAALKGVAGTQAEGEEAMTGPWALAAALNRYIVTLRRIDRSGA